MRGGFGPMMGGMNLGKLMNEAKKMQKELQKSSEEINAKEYIATTGGGALVLKMTGSRKVISLNLSDEIIEAKDKEMIQDLLTLAIEDIEKQIAQDQSKTMGSYNLNGLGGLGLWFIRRV